MTYRWINSIDEFKIIAENWDEALKQSGEDNPFLLSDFIITWWKYYSINNELMIFVVEDDNNVIAGIPLYLKRKGFRKILLYPGRSAANVTHFFSIDKKLNFIEKLFLALKKNKNWDILKLERVLSTNSLLSQLEEISSTHKEKLNYDINDNGLNGMIDLREGYDKVIASLGKRLQRYLRSSRKKIKEVGELKLERINGTETVKFLFSEFIRFSVESFKSRKEKSAFEDETYCSFFRDLLETFDGKDELDAHKLVAGNEIISVSFGYRFGNGFKWILTTFDQAYKDMRPGHLLIDELLKETINRGDEYYDMYYGGEVLYKQQWCNTMIPIKKVQIYRDTYLNKIFIKLEKTLRSNNQFTNIINKLKK